MIPKPLLFSARLCATTYRTHNRAENPISGLPLHLPSNMLSLSYWSAVRGAVMTNPRMVVCRECGRTRRHAAHGLCKQCFQRSNVVECAMCGNVKRHAAKGLCHRCYKRKYREPGIQEREDARKAQKAHAQAEHLKLLRSLRCKTCRRLLHLVRDVSDTKVKYCDQFCRYHDPIKRLQRGFIGSHPKPLAKLAARRAEAREMVGSGSPS